MVPALTINWLPLESILLEVSVFTDFRTQIKITKLTDVCVRAGSSYLAAFDSNSKVYLIDLKTGGFPTGTVGVLSLAANAVQIAFIEVNVIVAWVSASIYKVDFGGSGSVTALTSQSIFPQTPNVNYGPNNQMFASQISLKKAVGLSSASNFLTIDNSGGSTITNKFVVSGGKTFSSIIPHATSTGAYISGTQDGFIYELSFTGVVNKSFQLPLGTTTTKSGSAPSSNGIPFITSLAMDQTGTFLYVGTNGGFLYKIVYATNTIIEQEYVCSPGFPIRLSEIVNNQFLWSRGGISGPNGSTMPLMLCGGSNTVDATPTLELDYIGMNGAFGAFNSIGINAASGLGYGVIPGNGSAQDGDQIILFGIDGLTTSAAVEQSQRPPGSDIGPRMVRLGYLGPGLSFVELDSVIASGSTGVTPNIQGLNYYDVSIAGTVGVDETIDVRKLRA